MLRLLLLLLVIHVTHVRHTSLKRTCMTEKKLRATHPPLHSKRKVGEHVSQSREIPRVSPEKEDLQLLKCELKRTSCNAHVSCNEEAQLLKVSINAWMLHAAVAATAACYTCYTRNTYIA